MLVNRMSPSFIPLVFHIMMLLYSSTIEDHDKACVSGGETQPHNAVQDQLSQLARLQTEMAECSKLSKSVLTMQCFNRFETVCLSIQTSQLVIRDSLAIILTDQTSTGT